MEKFEAEQSFTNIDQLMEDVTVKLNLEDIGNTVDDPPVTIMIKPTGKFIEGEAEYKSVIYINATEAEVAFDLNPAPVQPSQIT